MPRKVKQMEITDFEAALALTGKSILDVMGFSSSEERVVVVVYPGPKHVFTRAEIEAEKATLRQRSPEEIDQTTMNNLANAAQDAFQNHTELVEAPPVRYRKAVGRPLTPFDRRSPG